MESGSAGPTTCNADAPMPLPVAPVREGYTCVLSRAVFSLTVSKSIARKVGLEGQGLLSAELEVRM